MDNGTILFSTFLYLVFKQLFSNPWLQILHLRTSMSLFRNWSLLALPFSTAKVFNSMREHHALVTWHTHIPKASLLDAVCKICFLAMIPRQIYTALLPKVGMKRNLSQAKSIALLVWYTWYPIGWRPWMRNFKTIYHFFLAIVIRLFISYKFPCTNLHPPQLRV